MNKGFTVSDITLVVEYTAIVSTLEHLYNSYIIRRLILQIRELKIIVHFIHACVLKSMLDVEEADVEKLIGEYIHT